MVRLRASQISDNSYFHSVSVQNDEETNKALVDTGATHFFIEPNQSSSEILPQKLPRSIELRLFGDATAPDITHVVNVTLDTGLSAPFSHEFLITNLEAKCSFVLGLDFLREVNPSVHWTFCTFSIDQNWRSYFDYSCFGAYRVRRHCAIYKHFAHTWHFGHT